MNMSSTNLMITQDQLVSLTFNFRNPDGSNFNLTGCSIQLAVRKNASSAPVIVKNVSNPAAGH